jgi:hypothetical protein
MRTNDYVTQKDKFVKIKLQLVRKLQVCGAGTFGFELSMFESVSSCKNISVPRHGK